MDSDPAPAYQSFSDPNPFLLKNLEEDFGFRLSPMSTLRQAHFSRTKNKVYKARLIQYFKDSLKKVDLNGVSHEIFRAFFGMYGQI